MTPDSQFVSDGKPWQISELAMILLLPDFMVQDVWEDFSKALATLNIEVLAITPAEITPQRLARLYRSHRLAPVKDSRLDGTWVTPTLIEWDMSLAVLVGARGAVDLSKELDQKKGPSPWWQRDSQHLRAVSPLSHRGMSLFHTPTDFGDCKQTIPLFFLPGIFENIRSHGTDRSLDWSDCQNIRGHTPIEPAAHPLGSVLSVLSRILTLLSVDAHIVPDHDFRFLAAQARELRHGFADLDPMRQRSIFEEKLREWGSCLDPLAPPKLKALPPKSTELERFAHFSLGQQRQALYKLLRLLLRSEHYGATLFDYARQTLALNHLHLSRWELHQLTTATVFYD